MGPPAQTEPPVAARGRAGSVAAWGSLSLTGILSALYALRPDWAYALTIWPAWIWLAPAIPLVAVAWRGSRRNGAVPLAAWLAFVVAFVGELMPLLRSLLPESEPGRQIEVVCLNCYGGNLAAVAEAMGSAESLVLIQESPSKSELERIARLVWGPGKWDVVAGPDASILAPGELDPLVLPEGTDDFVAAVWRWERLAEPVVVVSLRLRPPVLRFDYWNPACWTAYAEGKRARRKEMETIARFLESLPVRSPVIVGGDFNTPPDSSIQASLRARFVDAFEQSGRGWGATGLNETPVVRVDQIWVRRGMRTVTTGAYETVNSDHRMVRTTLALR